MPPGKTCRPPASFAGCRDWQARRDALQLAGKRKGRRTHVPLVIDFKSGDKLIINGVVVENGGPSSKLIVHNESAILREKEVLSAEDSKTPASRVYYALQCAYVFPQHRDDYLRQFRSYLADYATAAPSAKPVADKILKEVDAGKLYKGLKASQELIMHEAKVLDDLRQSLERNLPPEGEGQEG